MREDKKMPEHDAGFDAETAAAEADRAHRAGLPTRFERDPQDQKASIVDPECARWHAPDADLGKRQHVPAPMPGDLRQGYRAKEVYNGTAWVPLDKLEHVNVQTWEGVTPATMAALVGEPPIGEGYVDDRDERTKKWHLMWDTVKDIEIMFKRLQEQMDELADSDKTGLPEKPEPS